MKIPESWVIFSKPELPLAKKPTLEARQIGAQINLEVTHESKVHKDVRWLCESHIRVFLQAIAYRLYHTSPS